MPDIAFDFEHISLGGSKTGGRAQVVRPAGTQILAAGKNYIILVRQVEVPTAAEIAALKAQLEATQREFVEDDMGGLDMGYVPQDIPPDVQAAIDAEIDRMVSEGGPDVPIDEEE